MQLARFVRHGCYHTWRIAHLPASVRKNIAAVEVFAHDPSLLLDVNSAKVDLRTFRGTHLRREHTKRQTTEHGVSSAKNEKSTTKITCHAGGSGGHQPWVCRVTIRFHLTRRVRSSRWLFLLPKQSQASPRATASCEHHRGRPAFGSFFATLGALSPPLF